MFVVFHTTLNKVYLIFSSDDIGIINDIFTRLDTVLNTAANITQYLWILCLATISLKPIITVKIRLLKLPSDQCIDVWRRSPTGLNRMRTQLPISRYSCWRHGMETFAALLALCKGNPSVTDGFPFTKGHWCGALMSIVVNLDKALASLIEHLKNYAQFSWFIILVSSWLLNIMFIAGEATCYRTRNVID